MSLLIELIKTIAEAIEEGRGKQLPRQLPPPQRPAADPIDTVADFDEPDDLIKARQRLHHKQVEVHRARADAEARAKVTERRASAEIQRAAPRVAPGAERLGRLLRQPQTLRDLVTLKEILDKPLALRRDRR